MADKTEVAAPSKDSNSTPVPQNEVAGDSASDEEVQASFQLAAADQGSTDTPADLTAPPDDPPSSDPDTPPISTAGLVVGSFLEQINNLLASLGFDPVLSSLQPDTVIIPDAELQSALDNLYFVLHNTPIPDDFDFSKYILLGTSDRVGSSLHKVIALNLITALNTHIFPEAGYPTITLLTDDLRELLRVDETNQPTAQAPTPLAIDTDTGIMPEINLVNANSTSVFGLLIFSFGSATGSVTGLSFKDVLDTNGTSMLGSLESAGSPVTFPLNATTSLDMVPVLSSPRQMR